MMNFIQIHAQSNKELMCECDCGGNVWRKIRNKDDSSDKYRNEREKHVEDEKTNVNEN